MEAEALKFYKEGDKWYVDLPSYPGPKADLEMVMNADVALEALSDGAAEVSLLVGESDFGGASGLKLSREEDGGAWYVSEELGMEMWLCSVASFYFSRFPQEIWYRVVR